MGKYTCGDSVLRLGKAGNHHPGETFDAELSPEQERTLEAAGAITVLERSAPPPSEPEPWVPPTPPPPGPGADAPRTISTPRPPEQPRISLAEPTATDAPTRRREDQRRQR